MKFFLIAGEASGDLHGAELVRAIKKEIPQAQIHGWGGDLMAAEGVHLSKHIKDLAFMGFVEVALHLRTILSNFKNIQKEILEFEPHYIIGVDYPGFNLRMARWAHQNKFSFVQYIAPTAWAWKENRVKVLAACTHQLHCILPFEEKWFREHHVPQSYFIGHPLQDIIQNFTPNPNFDTSLQLDGRPLLAILPGSRKQEIKHMLPVMLRTAARFPQFQPVIAKAPALPQTLFTQIFNETGIHIPIVQSQTYDLLSRSKLAMVTSGTATLETALFGVPQVVCYKGNPISYAIAKSLVKVKYISLVNLILDQPILTELIQSQFTPASLHQHLEALADPHHPTTVQMMNAYQSLRNHLGQPGAANRSVKLMLQ